jgi:ABC-type sugar transport system permease subunit
MTEPHATPMRLILPLMGRALFAGISWAAVAMAVLMMAITVAVIVLSCAAILPYLAGGSGAAGAQFTGLEDETARTLTYATLTALAQILLAIGVAMYCLAHWPIKPVYLILMLTPYFVPSAFVHGTFSLLFLPDGFGTGIFSVAGVESHDWTTPAGRFARLVVASIWQFWPFAFLIAMARLLAVTPQESRSVALAARSSSETLGVIALRNLLAVVLAVFIARFLFMTAKFELPYLMSEEQADVTHNLLTVEVFRGLFKTFATPEDPRLPARVAAPAAAILMFCTLATLLVALISLGFRRIRRVPESVARLAFGWLKSSAVVLTPVSAILLTLFVIVPLIVLALSAFTPDSALTNGWSPRDSASGFTLQHFGDAYRDFQVGSSTSWYHAFLRTLMLSSAVAALAAVMGAVAGALLSVRVRWIGNFARAFSILAFGVPTTIWIFALAWANPSLSQLLPAGACVADTGEPSLIRGAECQVAVLWAMHLVVASSIALYLSLAFWRRTTSYEGFRLLKMYGVDAARPGQMLRALWLVRRRQLVGVFCAVFPIVFAVSWSDIAFSRYLAPDGQKLFVDAVAAGIAASSTDGTRFGQMAVAALLALFVATAMGMVVRRGLR